MDEDIGFQVVAISRDAFDNHIYYMTSDNVFSDWLTSLVTFFDKTLYSPRVTSSTKLSQRKRRDQSLL
jgi:hypothetical protein